MLLTVISLLAACSGSENGIEEENFANTGQGVFILNEGNYNSGNSTLSYYNPCKRTIDIFSNRTHDKSPLRSCH